MKTYDLIIIGAGTMGAAGAYYCRESGLDVLLIDAHHPPHEEGAHHGATRLFRYLYHNHAYQRLLNRAAALWDAIEAEHGVALLKRSGVINLAPEDDAGLRAKRAMAEHYGLPCQWLDAGAVRARWPGFAVPDGYAGLFEPEAGYLYSEKAVSLFLEQAQSVATAFHQPVQSIAREAEAVRVVTHSHVYHARRVAIAAGSWAQRIAGLDVALPFTPIRKSFAWYDAPACYHEAQGFPGFTVDTPEGLYYGFPDSGHGLKVGRHDGGEAMAHPGERFAYGHVASDRGDTDAFLARFLPQTGSLRAGRVCSYDRTLTEDFIISPHPEDARILLLAGFSGHGFKFAPAIGEIIAAFGTGQKMEDYLSFFRIK